MKKQISYILLALTLIISISISVVTVRAAEIEANVENKNIETGWLAAEATVPKNFVYDVYVTVIDKSGKEYTLMLYSVNKYLDRQEVPTGEYSIIGAGVMNDYTNTFPITYKNKSDKITVASKTSASLIQLQVDPADIEETTKESVEITKQEADTEEKVKEDIISALSPTETKEQKESVEQIAGSNQPQGILDNTSPSKTNTQLLAEQAGDNIISSIIFAVVAVVFVGVILFIKFKK